MADTGEPVFSNRTGRPPGRIITAVSRFVPGIRRVQQQIEPYAAHWEERNRTELSRTGPLCVVLGDSMAQGIGASHPERGWAGQLIGRLPGWRLVNLSQYGARVDDVLDAQLPVAEGLGTADPAALAGTLMILLEGAVATAVVERGPGSIRAAREVADGLLPPA